MRRVLLDAFLFSSPRSLPVKNNLQVNLTCCKHTSLLPFRLLEQSEIFPLLCFQSILVTKLLQLFIICGSEPRAPKKRLTNAATIEFRLVLDDCSTNTCIPKRKRFGKISPQMSGMEIELSELVYEIRLKIDRLLSDLWRYIEERESSTNAEQPQGESIKEDVNIHCHSTEGYAAVISRPR